MAVRSRWGTARKIRADGTPEPFVFTANDLNICKLLCSAVQTRTPWGYQYLPTQYFYPLLNHNKWGITARLREMTEPPHDFIKKPEQPRNNYRQIIYSLAPKGADELRNEGYKIPTLRLNALSHELMACICAASFEYGAAQHGLVIDANIRADITVRPDWPVFRLAGHEVLLEADTGSETIQYNAQATTIAEKFLHYLAILDQRTFKSPLIVFVTTRKSRAESMVKVLQQTIDSSKLPHRLARHFLFAVIPYDRYQNSIPVLTDWAVKSDYMRASSKLAPFNFLSPETI